MQRIDYSLESMLMENHFERMYKMHKGDLAEFEASFTIGCPKFLAPVPPLFDVLVLEDTQAHLEPLRTQVRVFLDEVG